MPEYETAVSYWTDRVFRFVEMVGVTALLGVVFEPNYPWTANTVTYIGTMFALFYLLEPISTIIVTSWNRGKPYSKWTYLRVSLPIVTANAIAYLTVPLVTGLTRLIAGTVGS